MQHNLLNLLTDFFRDGLGRIFTPPPATSLCVVGRCLLEQLRHHVANEEGLLKQLENGSSAGERAFLRTSPTVE